MQHSEQFCRLPIKSRNPINTLCLLKPFCLQFNAEAINRWLYLELVPCDVSEEESETSISQLLDNIFPHSFHSQVLNSVTMLPQENNEFCST